MMTLQHALKVMIFGALGFAFAPWGPTIAAMIVAGILGAYLGKRVLNKVSDRNFKRALDAVLVVISLRLIRSGVSDFGR